MDPILYFMVVYSIFYSLRFLDRLYGIFVINMRCSRADGTGIPERMLSSLLVSFSNEETLIRLLLLLSMIIACTMISLTGDPCALFFPSLITIIISIVSMAVMLSLHGYEEIEEIRKKHPLTYGFLLVLFLSPLLILLYSIAWILSVLIYCLL